MSEYWKSNPRKFCKLCSCWFGENKVSIENHERGKQHQENLKKQISQLGQKERLKKQQDAGLEQQLRRIEAAAQTAYANDVYTGKITEDRSKSRPLAVVPLPSKPKSVPKASPLTSNPATSWFQGKGPDNRFFYFNKVTHENLWEPPPCGFVSLPQQAKQIDLQLPKVDVSDDVKKVEQMMNKTIDEEFSRPPVEEKIVFQEKKARHAAAPGTIKVKAGGGLFDSSSAEPVAFRKRKLDKPAELDSKKVCL